MHRIFPDSRRKGWILTLFVLISLGAFISVQFTSNPVRASSTGPSFLEFESGQVRPIAMSPDGTKLFATNTPNGTLEIFNVSASGLTFQTRVPVGVDPAS